MSEAKKPAWKRWWMLAAAGVVVLLALVGLARSSSGVEAANKNDDIGTLEDPVRFDELVPIALDRFDDGVGNADSSVWNVRVSPPTDITADVLAASDYRNAPPGGVVFAGFDVEMTLASAEVEPFAPGYDVNWEILGGETAVMYDKFGFGDVSGCKGSTPNDFDHYTEVFVSGTLSGTVCIPLPVADLASSATSVVMIVSHNLYRDADNDRGADNDRIVFANNGTVLEPAGVGTPGQAVNTIKLGYGAPAPVTVTGWSDDAESVWNMTVSTPQDVTEAMLAASSSNEPPPDGFRFVGFDVEATLVSAENESALLEPPVFWELLGGSTATVYARHNPFDCGAADGQLPFLEEAFIGGSLAGQICIPLPVEDLDHPNTTVVMRFAGNRVIFTPNGP